MRCTRGRLAGASSCTFCERAALGVLTSDESCVYQFPISDQLRKLLPGTLSLKKVNTTLPASPMEGGRRGSFSIRGMSLSCHCNEPFSSLGFSSLWFTQSDLKRQPDARCSS